MPKPKLICPTHQERLIAQQTRYGVRMKCHVEGCTVACWGGDTSTPADQETRDARIAAHTAFDSLWKVGPLRRAEAYKWLREVMGLSAKKAHIGMFSKEQCGKLIDAVNAAGGKAFVARSVEDVKEQLG